MTDKTPTDTLDLNLSESPLSKIAIRASCDFSDHRTTSSANSTVQDIPSCDPNSCGEFACKDGFTSEGHLPPTIDHNHSDQPRSTTTPALISPGAKHRRLETLINGNRSSAPMLPLSGGSPGDRYSVVRLCSNHLSTQDDDLKGRLQMYGVVPGTELVIDRIAPLGDPITLRVRGTELALRRREAACIIVAPCIAENNLKTDGATLSRSVRDHIDSNEKVVSNL